MTIVNAPIDVQITAKVDIMIDQISNTTVSLSIIVEFDLYIQKKTTEMSLILKCFVYRNINSLFSYVIFNCSIGNIYSELLVSYNCTCSFYCVRKMCKSIIYDVEIIIFIQL